MKKVVINIILIIISINYLYSINENNLDLVKLPIDYNLSPNSATFYNPYLVKYDTVSSSPTYNQLYGKKYYSIYSKLDKYLFSNMLRADTSVDWHYINDSLTTIKNKFQFIDTNYGSFWFIRPDSVGWFKQSDSVHLLNTVFYIEFNNYQNIDTIMNLLRSIDSNLVIGNNMNCAIPCYLGNDISFNPRASLNSIYKYFNNEHHLLWTNAHNPPYSIYPNNFHKLGFIWNIYATKAPMAWEITMGRPEIVININDSFREQNPGVSHDELSSNFLPITSADGIASPYSTLFADHGLGVMSYAVGKIDNYKPMVGLAPNCMAISSSSRRTPVLDIDNSINKSFLYPDVINCSWIVPDQMWGPRDWVKEAFQNGIVVIATIGNQDHRGYTINGKLYASTHYPGSQIVTDPSSPDDPKKDTKVIAVASTQDGKYVNSSCNYWNNTQVIVNKGSEQFKEDYNYSVGIDKFNESGSRQSIKEDATVDICAPGKGALAAWDDNCFPVPGNNYEGNITCTNDIYTQCNNLHEIGSEEWFDCVCPDTMLKNIPFESFEWWCAAAFQQYGKSKCLEHAVAYARKYCVWQGTSISAPMISGIAALMLSVNKFLGEEIDNSVNRPINGFNVQRKVYNILTFTSDKIQDFCNFDPSSNWTENPYTHVPLQYDYVEQSNDDLKRWWAQRMGFGRVNAYRSVAHSIANKGSYEYTSSLTLPFTVPSDPRGYVNEYSKMLMHFGSRAKEGQDGISERNNIAGNQEINVLEYGGASLPGESFNNQGVTVLNNSSDSISLTVPENSILAIDGILKSPQTELHHKIVTLTGGKILMEGYLENVRLDGYVKLSDLIINGSLTSNLAGVRFGFSPVNNDPLIFANRNDMCSIHGKVYLQNNAFMHIDGCPVIVRPGSEIYLEGSTGFDHSNKDIRITNGGKLLLEGATKIKDGNFDENEIIPNTTNVKRHIIVEGQNSELIIDENAKVEILCKVLIKSGATFYIKKNAIVKLNEFGIEQGGTLFIEAGAHINLNRNYVLNNSGVSSWIEGSIDALVPVPIEKKAVITSKVSDCCLDICDEVNSNISDIYQRIVLKPSSYCSVPNLELKNVFFDIQSFNNESINIENCTFTSIKNEPYGELGLGPMLLISTPGNVTISNCSFSGPSATFSGQREFKPFYGVGVDVSGARAVTVTSSTFSNLNYGISSSQNNTLVLQSNKFQSGMLGVLDLGSANMYCTNEFTDLNYGAALFLSADGKLNHNAFSTTKLGITNWYSSYQNLLGNSWNEYSRALYSQDGRYELGTNYVSDSCSAEYGRNSFTLLNPRSFNPFQPTERADLEFHPSGMARIFYGYNDWSDSSDFHIVGEGPLSIGYNNYRPFGFVRDTGITALNDIFLTLASAPGESCNESCSLNPPEYYARHECEEDGYSFTYPWNFDFTVNNYNLTESEKLDLLNYIQSLIQDSTMDCYCRYRKLQLALSASNGLGAAFNTEYRNIMQSIYNSFPLISCDSISFLVDILRADLYAKSYRAIFDSLSVDTLIFVLDSTIRIYADLKARQGLTIEESEFAKTKLAYYTWLAETYRQRRYIDSLMADSTFTGSLDSLNLINIDSLHNEYYMQVKASLSLFPKFRLPYIGNSGRDPNRVNEASAELWLGQNKPNPFKDETTIEFYLPIDCRAKLVIYDLLGNTIAVPVNSYMSSGRHNITFKTGELSGGSYFYKLESCGKTLSKQLQIIK